VLRALAVVEEAVRITVQQRDLFEGPLRHPAKAMYLREKSGAVANPGAENNRNGRHLRANNGVRASVAREGTLCGGPDTASDLKRLVLPATVSAAMFLGCACVAYAADIDGAVTKAPVSPQASPPPSTCTGIPDFFLTACQLSWYGVRFYGTIDVGFGYQTHGAPFDANFVTGASYFLQKMNRPPMWGLAPNGLSQSNVGVQIKEPLSPAWSFVAQLEAEFDPYSLHFANSTGSVFANAGVPVNQQTTNGDASRAGRSTIPWASSASAQTRLGP
jgi:hypothetical protein